MKTSELGRSLIRHFESLRLTPYLCDAGVPTIGWGNTFYPNGAKVTLRDKAITRERADQIFDFVLALFENDVESLLKVDVKQHQFDALVSFAYNVGTDIDVDNIPEGLGDSTLLHLVNKNPNDDRIVAEFLKWNKSRGKILRGLTRRRSIEAYLYTTGKLNLKQ